MPEISSTEMDETFRKTLLSTGSFIAGLRALDCTTWGPAAPLARLCFAGSQGGYYVHAGLVHDAGMPADRWLTAVSAVWVPEHGGRRYALDVRMSGPGARDGRLLADLVLTAVITDQADHDVETEEDIETRGEAQAAKARHLAEHARGEHPEEELWPGP